MLSRATTMLLLALAVAHTRAAWAISPALVAQTASQERMGGGAVRSLLSSMGLATPVDEVQHFRGGMYGVSASVALNIKSRHAVVSLRGAPVGGSLTGTGWLAVEQAHSLSGAVVLDPDFQKLLARRFVSIQHASLDRATNQVSVTVTVPIFGQTVLVLQRVEGP